MAWARGETAKAVQLCEDGIALARPAADEAGLAYGLGALAWACYTAGHVAAGNETADEALAWGEDHASPTVVANARLALHFGAVLAGDLAAQREHLTAALAAMEEGGYAEQSDWLGLCGAMAASEGRFRSAVRLLGGSRGPGHRHGSRPPTQMVEVLTPAYGRAFQAVGQPLADRMLAQGAEMTWDELKTLGLEEPPRPATADPLTSREREIAELVGKGLSNVDIAARLIISRRTVESHVVHIKQKLGLANRHEVMAWAIHELRATPDP